ncbi:hypothetical protein OHD62_09195 [Mesorhizobium sp. YC-39]|uniref:hypothetical protein n=1 Tax=unclassified Mesorhizobium TaxID=325217 RepID=UPI0021E795A4|nr:MULTISPECIES: hypothetical protein [unclassified Mesorhizobium]MCV3205058.1 hypothetical protein [Mesorhizobium sp. YC-2]MCV3228543.1 hypothetical protein [Mesorhizobium sp. YC-39]
MKTAFLHAVWIVAFAAMPALAGNTAVPSFEVTLDMDNDGRMDRALIIEDRDNGQADLAIYLAAGDGKIDPSRQPSFVRKALTDNRILDLESTGMGSLAITSCFGCGANKSWEETLTIVRRHGEFLVGGYSRNWDWNVQKSDGTVETTLGSCDINFLTGKGVASQDLDDSKPVEGKFTPIALADWSYETRPKPCEF